jgi:enterochelin esterase family protein
VFYLLHGAGDNDDAWSSVGRAGFILDNLIAAKKARPMIVVMPAGHTSRGPGSALGRAATDAFVNDFVKDVMPYVEAHYRVLKDRANTAIAGLSMGGSQTLQVAIPRLERFGYIGCSARPDRGFPNWPARRTRRRPTAPAAVPPRLPHLRSAAGPALRRERLPYQALRAGDETAAEWANLYAAKLDDPKLKKGLKLLWFGTGKDDFLISTTKATVDLFKKHGFSPVFEETAGAQPPGSTGAITSRTSRRSCSRPAVISSGRVPPCGPF